ncbi:hypothetical protein Emed_004501 [Eimeria media]
METPGVCAAEATPCPLTEGEHSFYSQQAVCHVAAQLLAFEPANTLSIHYDGQHGRLLHQVPELLFIRDCFKVHPKLADGYPIRFTKPKCMSMSFSPCGNFLLYVTAPAAKAAAAAAPAAAAGGDSAAGGTSGSAEGGAPSGAPQEEQLPREALRQEVGIVDVFGDECLTTAAPLRGGSLCDEIPSVLQAFWAPTLTPPSAAEASSLVVVVTQKNIELFRFTHKGKRLHALKKVPQMSLLAWVLPAPPKTPPLSSLPDQSAAATSPATAATAAAAAAAAVVGPVVFVVAVGQRTLQPFLLDPKTLSLVRLPKIELNLPLWQALQQRDVYVFMLYDTAYCVHADSHAGRISLRAITGPLQPDTVLDALAPGELQLLALDNMLVVYHAALETVLLYDVQRSPVCGGGEGLLEGAPGSQPGGAPSGSAGAGGPPSLRLKGKAAAGSKADVSKGVRALVPLVKGTPLASHAAPLFSAGEETAAGGKGEETENHNADGLSDVELQATNLALARFISPDVIIDEELGGAYRLSLNTNAIMHRLLKERQSLVLQNRSNSKAEVLRLALHALRLETPLAELQPLLFLLNSKYRAAIEQVPLSLVAVSRKQQTKEAAAAAGGAAAAAAGASAAATAAATAAAADAVESAAGAMACGRATIPLELLLQSIGSQTVVTERDLVLNLFYPFIRQQYNLPPNGLLLDASFPAKAGEKGGPSEGPLGAPKGYKVFVEGGLTGRGGPAGSAMPYVLSVVIEYTRTLLMLQIFPHKVLQAFLFDACVFFKRGPQHQQQQQQQHVHLHLCSIHISPSRSYCMDAAEAKHAAAAATTAAALRRCVCVLSGDVLKQLLQYHLLLDSTELVERLFVVWRQLAAAAAAGDRGAARDECWLRQACLDAALRLKDWNTIVSILLACKQHKEVIPLLREHGAWDYPLKRILHAVATDVEAQREQPGLLQLILGHIRAWLSECKARKLAKAPPIPPPNLTDCGAWLPGVDDEAPPQPAAKLQQQQQQQQQREQQQEEEEEAGSTIPRNKQPQLIEAIGVVAQEYCDAPHVEGEEDAARGWESLTETEGVCGPTL